MMVSVYWDVRTVELVIVSLLRQLNPTSKYLGLLPAYVDPGRQWSWLQLEFLILAPSKRLQQASGKWTSPWELCLCLSKKKKIWGKVYFICQYYIFYNRLEHLWIFYQKIVWAPGTSPPSDLMTDEEMGDRGVKKVEVSISSCFSTSEADKCIHTF